MYSFLVSITYKNFIKMDQQDYRRQMRKKGDADAKKAGIGCIVFILLGVVGTLASSGGAAMTALGLIAIVALFVVGAFLTGAFDD